MLLSPLLLLYAGEMDKRITLDLGRISGPDWVAEGIALELLLGEGKDLFRVSITSVTHPALPAPLTSLVLTCNKGRVTDSEVDCRKGQLALKHSAIKQRQIPIRFKWMRESQDIELTVEKLLLFGSVVKADLSLKGERWTARGSAKKVDLTAVGKMIAAVETVRREYGATGVVDLNFSLSGGIHGVGSASWKGKLREAGFSYQEESYIGEALSASFKGKVRKQRGVWRGTQEVALTEGALLTPQFFLAPEGKPVSVKTGFSFASREQRLAFNQFEFNHPDVIHLNGQGELILGDEVELSGLEMVADEAQIATLFSAYFQPVLADPIFETLELAGKVSAKASLGKGGEAEVQLKLNEVFVEEGGGNESMFALYGINGELNWQDQGKSRKSSLSWRGGHLFGGIDLGASSMELGLEGANLALKQPTSLPVLDGALEVESFNYTQEDDGPQVHFQGFLTPVSMEKVSHAMNWPLLSGQLSGMIPGISYSAGAISINGMALVRVFGGKVLLRNLVLDDFFGVLPALTADVELKNLDLETLTRTFSFGKITGKIEGEVKGLRLEDWQPVSFDAWLATPGDDESRHRISQKAVDSISNLGGSGVAGALSRSFMRFFNEFGYDRLGVRCTLDQGICMMSGVEKAERGYYLVKGGGIPRIDIIGFNRRTDWNVLVSKLQQIAEGGAPSIE